MNLVGREAPPPPAAATVASEDDDDNVDDDDHLPFHFRPLSLLLFRYDRTRAHAPTNARTRTAGTKSGKEGKHGRGVRKKT